ncbi:hypothetical protein M8818_000817 [Zalaria obscura]|uniref:Uncharacterized protein n=1 Tax=Zalaria obscura TaxID=2024903 RepID=A0ACC3SR27_9PEZI
MACMLHRFEAHLGYTRALLATCYMSHVGVQGGLTETGRSHQAAAATVRLSEPFEVKVALIATHIYGGTWIPTCCSDLSFRGDRYYTAHVAA